VSLMTSSSTHSTNVSRTRTTEVSKVERKSFVKDDRDVRVRVPLGWRLVTLHVEPCHNIALRERGRVQPDVRLRIVAPSVPPHSANVQCGSHDTGGDTVNDVQAVQAPQGVLVAVDDSRA
jgi:hypothetical protein